MVVNQQEQEQRQKQQILYQHNEPSNETHTIKITTTEKKHLCCLTS